ncbi:MAG: hypothetical protein RPR28_03420 [Cycloclasticus sp.]
MNNTNTVEKKTPYCSILSVVCAMSSLPLARLGAEWFAPKEDYTGYGGLGVAIAILVVSLVLGLTLGLIGTLRSEKPKALAVSITLMHASAIIILLLNKPG